MSKFLKYLVQGRKILDTDTQFDMAYMTYLKGVIINHLYTQVLHLHKNDKPEDFVFKNWTLSLVAHDMSESTCKKFNIPCCKVAWHHMQGFPYCRHYFLLAENKTSDRKYLIPVDTYTFAWADNDIIKVPNECVREKWLREELDKWVTGLCNTDADITEWRYLKGFFAWWNRLIYDIVRCDYE